MLLLLVDNQSFSLAAQSAVALVVSHALCCGIVMHHDLSGKWGPYQLHPKRSSVSVQEYLDGAKSFVADLIFLFLPFMTLCYSFRPQAIVESQDSIIVALTKVVLGYVFGKVWAFGVHYLLHFPAFYNLHRAHHCNPKTLVASRAWQDTYAEYCIMELPSFAMPVLLLPTHIWAHLLHFICHGWDGAAGHSGFSAPGWLGWAFDGTYHYRHHAHLTVNYAEIEFLDLLCGTHHSQQT